LPRSEELQIHVCHRSLWPTNASLITVTGCFADFGLPTLGFGAEWFTGFTLFSGVKSENGYLPFRFWQFNQWVGSIPAEIQQKALKLRGGIVTIAYQTAKASTDKIGVNQNKRCKEVKWDKRNHWLKSEGAGSTETAHLVGCNFLTLKIDFGGTYYFGCQSLPLVVYRCSLRQVPGSDNQVSQVGVISRVCDILLRKTSTDSPIRRTLEGMERKKELVSLRAMVRGRRLTLIPEKGRHRLAVGYFCQ